MAEALELTPGQQALIPAFLKEMWEAGSCTDPADWVSADETASEIFREIGNSVPPIYHVDSPVAAKALCNILSWISGGRKVPIRDVIEQKCSTTWQGQFDVTNWASEIFACRIGLTTDEDRIRRVLLLERLAKSCGPMYAFEEAVVICNRPKLIVWDEEGKGVTGYPTRLHCATGPAILYRDGWSEYFWHGVKVSRRHIEDKTGITQEDIDSGAHPE